MIALNEIKNKLTFLKEKNYIKKRFFNTFGYKINFNSPKSFSENIQWLKLYNRNPLYTKLVDKFEVRTYVKHSIGESYLNELYGVWDNYLDIDYSQLPDQFVLKATHGSTWNVLCCKKSELDLFETSELLRKWTSENYYYRGFEWVYKDVPPMIICEKYLGSDIFDYKFFCFNGSPKFIQIDVDRHKNHRRAFYSLKWELLPFTVAYEKYTYLIDMPKNIKEMIDVAAKLSKGFPFVRVDFYSILDSVIFGEMTFFPENGFGTFMPPEYDHKIGKLFNTYYDR